MEAEIFTMPFREFAVYVIAGLAGMVSHFLKKMMELRRDGATITIRSYFIEAPYATASTIIAVVFGSIGLIEAGEAGIAACFFYGMSVDSIANLASKRANARP